MSTPVATVTVKDTIEKAVQIMATKNIGCLVVVQGKKPVGIFTERDVLRKVFSKKIPLSATVDKIMTRRVKTAGIDTTIVQISQIMSKNHFRRIVIVDHNGNLKGIITSRDLMEFLSV